MHINTAKKAMAIDTAKKAMGTQHMSSPKDTQMQSHVAEGLRFPFCRTVICSVGISLLLLALSIFPTQRQIQASQTKADGDASNIAKPQQTSQVLLALNQTSESSNQGGKALLVNLALRRAFDDIISEHSNNAVRLTQAIFQLAQQLDLVPNARNKLQALFQRYFDYRKQLTKALASLRDVDETRDLSSVLHLQRLQTRLQAQLFSPEEVDAFFSKENDYNQQALARMQIRIDASLNLQQKQTAIKAQISQLPPNQRNPLMASLKVQNIVSALQPDRDLSQEFDYSTEALRRIEELKQHRQHWQTKVTKARELAGKIAALEANSAQKLSLQQKFDDYLAQAFNANERKRLKVFLNNPNL